jgi:hypothetical protein
MREKKEGVMRDGKAQCSLRGLPTLLGAMFVLGLSLVGCLKPVPKVSIPGSDASPPTLVWEIYNLQTKERREITQDAQTLDVPANEQLIVRIAVEDLQSGVKDVSLDGEGQYACELGGKIDKKAVKLEQQNTTRIADHEKKVPVSASLSYTVEFGKMGCKESERFAGGKLSLVGKGHNFVNGAGTKSLHFDLKKQASP